jgi:hypothetical protein
MLYPDAGAETSIVVDPHPDRGGFALFCRIRNGISGHADTNRVKFQANEKVDD